MHINKAVITAAGPRQRTLPLQTLIDSDGIEKSVLNILAEEVLDAGIEEVCFIVSPGSEDAYAAVAGEHVRQLTFVPQTEPLGHGHAVYCAQEFTGDEPFLHLVGDHLYVSHGGRKCAQHLLQAAAAHSCTVSAVQATRETLLPYFGAVGGRRVAGRQDLYEIETVIEKPTPTEAEQRLIVPGLRAGHYLCYFGMHVLMPSVMDILGHLCRAQSKTAQTADITLSAALGELAKHEQYLGLEQHEQRFDVGVKYGLLTAQLAIALNGTDRDEVLSRLLELLAQRELFVARSQG